MSTPMIDRAMKQLGKYSEHDTPFFRTTYDVSKRRYFDSGFEIVEMTKDAQIIDGPGEIMVEISKEAANKSSRMMLIHSIITGLENLAEDATDPHTVLAAIEAVRRIK
jgi:hypothetical protein